MLKWMSIIHRRSDMTPEAFRRYWKDVHGPMLGRIPGVRKYVQNHVVGQMRRDDVAPGAAAPDGMTEIYFDDRAAWEAAMRTPQMQEALADTANFIGTITTLFVEETPIIAGDDGEFRGGA